MNENYPAQGTAWEYIGFDGEHGSSLRIKGGHALYEAAIYYDETPGNKVKLVRIDTTNFRLRQVERYVDPDTILELVKDAA